MKDYKNVVHALLCLSFSIIVGGAVFEHLTIWPKAFYAPPASLSMLQGEYGFDGSGFWQLIHPITLLLFMVTLIILWKTERKKYILFPFIGYVIVMIVTTLYFVPELIAITSTNYDTTVDQDLVQRGSLWISLSLIRLAIIAVLAVILSLGLTKSNTRIIKI